MEDLSGTRSPTIGLSRSNEKSHNLEYSSIPQIKSRTSVRKSGAEDKNFRDEFYCPKKFKDSHLQWTQNNISSLKGQDFSIPNKPKRIKTVGILASPISMTSPKLLRSPKSQI